MPFYKGLKQNLNHNIMKKLIATLAVLMVFSMAATNVEAKRFGVKGGVNVTDLNFENGRTPGALGYQLGITWQRDLPLGLSIQPELLYHVKATKFDQIESQLGLGYVEVPLNVQWGLRFANKKIRAFAQASPFVGYAITQTGNETGESIFGDYKDLAELVGIETDKWEGINRLSYGAGLGAGVQLGILQITAQYNWNFGSILDLKDTDWEQIKDKFNESNHSGYTISLGILF